MYFYFDVKYRSIYSETFITDFARSYPAIFSETCFSSVHVIQNFTTLLLHIDEQVHLVLETKYVHCYIKQHITLTLLNCVLMLCILVHAMTLP